jgi:uncharacterized membrane-anchored protein
MKNNTVIRLFLGLALIQLLVPGSMIVKREIVLKEGAVFKFKVAPVDPYDAFRGRYVALRAEENSVAVSPEVKVSYGQAVYVPLAVDGEGFARLAGISLVRPLGQAYLRAKVSSRRYDNKVYLKLPIDRYYMEEWAAPQAENIYRQHASVADRKDSYIVVRIKDGLAVVENLYVGGLKIEEAVKGSAKIK